MDNINEDFKLISDIETPLPYRMLLVIPDYSLLFVNVKLPKIITTSATFTPFVDETDFPVEKVIMIKWGDFITYTTICDYDKRLVDGFIKKIMDEMEQIVQQNYNRQYEFEKRRTIALSISEKVHSYFNLLCL
jgi:hypothetical protein